MPQSAKAEAMGDTPPHAGSPRAREHQLTLCPPLRPLQLQQLVVSTADLLEQQIPRS
jgi:hypothetical protein